LDSLNRGNAWYVNDAVASIRSRKPICSLHSPSSGASCRLDTAPPVRVHRRYRLVTRVLRKRPDPVSGDHVGCIADTVYV